MAQKLVGTTEAAEMLGVHPTTVRRMAKGDESDGGPVLEPVKVVRGAYLFRKYDVEKLARKRQKRRAA